MILISIMVSIVWISSMILAYNIGIRNMAVKGEGDKEVSTADNIEVGFGDTSRCFVCGEEYRDNDIMTELEIYFNIAICNKCFKLKNHYPMDSVKHKIWDKISNKGIIGFYRYLKNKHNAYLYDGVLEEIIQSRGVAEISVKVASGVSFYVNLIIDYGNRVVCMVRDEDEYMYIELEISEGYYRHYLVRTDESDRYDDAVSFYLEKVIKSHVFINSGINVIYLNGTLQPIWNGNKNGNRNRIEQ